MERICTLVLVLYVFSSQSFADRVVLKNGDQLKGTVVKMEGGKMVLNSDMLGEVTIDMTNVRSFETDESQELHFSDGTVIHSGVKQDQPGEIAIADSSTVKAQSFSLADLFSINPPKVPPGSWSGSFNVGFTSSHGNSFDQSGSVSLDATRDNIKTDYQAKSRWANRAIYLIGRSERDVATGGKEKFTTEESVGLRSKYDHFFNDKMYGFVNGSWKKDHVADLDRRLVGGGGLGREWVNDGTILFTTDIGAALVHEKYVTKIPNPVPPPGMITKSDSSDEISAQLGYLFNWLINERFSFFHDTVYYPSMEEVSDYFLTSSAELRMKINADWHGSVKALLDYDSTPGQGSSTTDMKYILGVGWTF